MSKDSRTVRKVDGVSPSLIGALKTAEVSIETCRNNLPYALFRKQIAGIFKEIDNQLLHNLVNKWEVQFDDSGAAQFKVDVEKGIESLCCGDQKLKVAKKLRDACILLNLRNTLNAQSDTSLERNLGMNLKINMKKRGVIDDIHMILYRFIEDTSHNYASVLESINVFNLSKQDALDILDSIAN